ncbi:P-loop containing nucleoside triphosphate hydrolase protein [Mycena pura]|uniref:P-loop containing nucleoside triphosphate hydrolase protein n=1 Tax=Mycena pura TaxID=153505 RepID=A0AAD6UQH3_9AGAR|nr:P-loop containing nucleoside triphosphate hydrolase protein [Mycena pura]
MKTSAQMALEEMTLGVWRVLTETTLGLATRWRMFSSLIPTIHRFVSDVYTVGSGHLILIFLCKVWSSFEDVLLLYLSSKILTVIEVGLKEGKPDTTAVVIAVTARTLVVAISACVESWRARAASIMENRVTHHFAERIFSFHTSPPTAKLETDMPTSHGTIAAKDYNNEDASLSAQPVWENFMSVTEVAAIGLQAINPTYVRLQALRRLGDDQYRQDIISDNIGDYILQEYEDAQKGLEDVETDHPLILYDNHRSLLSSISLDIAGDLAMLFYAVNAIRNPDKFTLTTIAMLQHSESTLQRTFYRGIGEIREVTRGMNFMKRLYKICNLTNVIKDGVLKYPSTDQADTPEPLSSWHSFSPLRNVTFSYPGGEANAKALDNVTLSIKSGQLVVLVGANGSGKSTIVKLLVRLYDPTSGQVLVDSQDIQNYSLADLRAATASLTQDHHLYPLSLAENIGLGDSRRVADGDAITDAARRGGADGFVSKLKEGYATVLDPQTDWSTMHVKSSDGTPLAKEMEKLEKSTDISGTIKLVIADEGSSALDPQAEWELFKNLREHRKGKTIMVFVTHRFGHLTKHADIILCMKEGRLVESGTHEDLMKIPDGEYSKLYAIQAKAFDSATV